MFKWSTDRSGRESLGHCLVSVPEAVAAADAGRDGRASKGLLGGETTHLRRLRSHLTVLQPGAGYEPHVDAYDIGIVVLEGTVETLGERVGPNGVVFYAAGEPHGMRNVGESSATYVVFEFHGAAWPVELEDPRPSRRLLRAIRHPRRLARTARRRGRAAARRVRRPRRG
jgi:hypothetical protein